jgi:hypothetical protein
MSLSNSVSAVEQHPQPLRRVQPEVVAISGDVEVGREVLL